MLAQIDPRPYQAALDQARGHQGEGRRPTGERRRDLDRYALLAPRISPASRPLDTQRALVAQLQAQVEGDQAAIDSAKTQLDYTTIGSPIDGRTGIRLVDPGNIVHAADTTGIVVVTQVQPIAVIFTLPEDELRRWRGDGERKSEVVALVAGRQRPNSSSGTWR